MPLRGHERAGAGYPRSYYAASANEYNVWPQLVDTVEADVCVVGGGFTGVSAALHLAERGYDVVLLEAARIGWGASGRNGGQIGSGLRADVRELESRLGRETARTFWQMAEEAKRLIVSRIERHAIACDYRVGNLMAITRERFVDDIAREAEHLAAYYDYGALRMLDRARMHEEVASTAYAAGRMDEGGGHLHPLNFVLAMARAAGEAGVRVFEDSCVELIHWGARPEVRTGAGCVRTRIVLLCGNAYLGRFAPALAGQLGPRVMPIANHIIATEPLGEARARSLIRSNACVHATKFVVDYYRLSADHRLVFGGGESYSYDPPPDLAGFVRRYMLRVFPQLSDVRVDFAWSGQLAITFSRLPAFGRLGANGYYVHGFSGHGVALTQLAG
ncbi:MAG: NAD(P)/FAD-dependent oxidoreductase, partial [Gammaproteobacteria bacterium]